MSSRDTWAALADACETTWVIAFTIVVIAASVTIAGALVGPAWVLKGGLGALLPSGVMAGLVLPAVWLAASYMASK